MIGETVGSYRVVAKISTGGMGTVYRAEHSLIGKQAAVKVLHEELCHNREIVNRFFNEAKATTTIKHPGIVEIFDFGYMESGDAYIVMEFLDGMSLARRLTESGRIEEGEAAMIMRAVCSALAAAHAKKIVHRDLKPDNVFMVVDPEAPTGERPKILDFGIAKLADTSLGGPTSATKTGAVMGTPTYMSPEQCRGTGEVDERSDLYSIGCMFYELLTGEPPFPNMAAGELIGAHLFIEPEKPTVRNANISQEAEALTMALLAKKPADRPQTAREVAQRFADLAKNHGWMAQTNPTAHRAAARMTGNVSSGHDATVASPHGLMVPPAVARPASSETPNVLIGIGKTPIPPVDTQPMETPKPTTLTSAASQSAHHDVATPKRRTGLFVGLGVAALAAGVISFVALKGSGSKDTRPAAATEPAGKPAADDTKPTAVEVAKPATGDTATGDIAKPATGDTKPATGDTAKPATGDTKPATGDTAKPATGDIAKPATDDTAKPATGDIAKPATGDIAKPATGDAKPAVATTKPATTKPATTKPATTKPAVATTKPATTKPATTKPATTTTKPATTTTKPGTTKPGQGSGKILIETDL